MQIEKQDLRKAHEKTLRNRLEQLEGQHEEELENLRRHHAEELENMGQKFMADLRVEVGHFLWDKG